jgi:hypothetical protein
MKTLKMKVLTASLLVAMGIASDAWAVAGNATPNSTTNTVHVNVLFNGNCYQNAFDSRYSSASWYSTYSSVNASASIWGYLYTSFTGDVTFKTTRHGNNGAVYQVDLASTLGAGAYTVGSSSSSASTYTYANATDWWSGNTTSFNASSYNSGYATNNNSSSANSDTTVFTKGANITEFKAHVALNASQFSDLNTSDYLNVWSSASTYAGWPSYSYASAYAQAYADLVSQSVVYLDITAHYQKKPGSDTDVQTVIDNVTGYLSCGGYTSPFASTDAFAY